MLSKNSHHVLGLTESAFTELLRRDKQRHEAGKVFMAG